MRSKGRWVIAGMTLFGAFIGVVVGGSATHMLAAAAAGFVGASIIVALDRSDPKQ